MKSPKPALILAALISIPVLVTPLRAQDFTYAFTATPEDRNYTPALNGSTVTFLDNAGNFSVIGWDLTDGTYTLDSALISPAGNSAPGTLNYGFAVAVGAGGFIGGFEVDGTVQGNPVVFSGSYTNLNTSLTDTTQSHLGTWAYVPPIVASAPDAANTAGLLLAGATAVALGRRRVKGRLA